MLKSRYCSAAAVITVILLLVIGTKISVSGTGENKLYAIADITGIESSDISEIGQNKMKLVTVKAKAEIDGKKDKHIIQEFTYTGKSEVKKIEKDDKVLVRMNDKNELYDASFVDYVKTDMLIVLAISLLLLIILISNLKGVVAAAKMLFALFSVAFMLAISFTTGRAVTVNIVFCTAVLIISQNFIAPRNIGKAVYDAVFTAVCAAITWGLAAALTYAVGLSDRFDLTIFNAEQIISSEYYTDAPFSAAVIIAAVVINIFFTSSLSELLTHDNAVAVKGNGFLRFRALLTALFNRRSARMTGMLCTFMLGIMPLSAILFSGGRSMLGLLNNEYSSFVLCTVIISALCCIISLITAAFLLYKGWVADKVTD